MMQKKAIGGLTYKAQSLKSKEVNSEEGEANTLFIASIKEMKCSS